MNVILEGPDATGKTTLADKLCAKYGMTTIHSTSKTRNDLYYHLDLLDYHFNTVFDRFHIGEQIFPIIYNRQGMMTNDEYEKVNERIIDNNDILVVFMTSDINILNNRLIERGEESYLEEIDQQNSLFTKYAINFKNKYPNYKNFYIIDISEELAYEKLDKWISNRINSTTPNVVYRSVCKDLVEKGHTMETKNIRGNTKELCNYSFTITDIENSIITLKTGKCDYVYLAGELLWYWSSRDDLDFIGKFSKMWKKLSDDGVHSNSAYGYILQEKYGFNQIEKIIELLSWDPYSRRAVLNLNVPNENVIDTKDEICTVCLIYQIRENKLHCTCVMRSNDVNYGLRNDLGYFLMLQKYIADRLGVGYGTYTHFSASMHVYEKDFSFAKNVAYGTLESVDKSLDVDALLDNKELLIDYIDNHWTGKEDFENLLESLLIIK